MEFLSVWYNIDEFIFNTYTYPFQHNLIYLSKKFNVDYTVVYFIEDISKNDVQNRINDVIKRCPSIHFVNFPLVFAEYVRNVKMFTQTANKIDFIKIVSVAHFQRISRNKKNDGQILLLDFDCDIRHMNVPKNLQLKAFFVNSNLLREFSEHYDRHADILIRNCDSYVENYALLISKDLCFLFESTITIIIENTHNEHFSNSFVYVHYIDLIVNLYKIVYNIDLPDYVNDTATISSICGKSHASCIDMRYNRGGSWDVNFKQSCETYSNFDCLKKPIYLYEYDLLENQIKKFGKNKSVFDDVKNLLRDLLHRGLNYELNDYWINSKQRKGNLREFMEDIQITSSDIALLLGNTK